MEIMGKNTHLFIDETHEKLLVLDGDESIKSDFKDELQSSLTTKIVKDVFEKDDCLLPSLKQSSFVHFELFRIFNNYLRKVGKMTGNICPIT